MGKNKLRITEGLLGLLLMASLACGLPQALQNQALSTKTPGTQNETPVQPASPQPKGTTQEAPQTNPNTPNNGNNTANPNLKMVSFNGIRFSYDPELAKDVKTGVVPATGPESDQQPIFTVNAKEDQFNFQEYTIKSSMEASLLVFPVNEYEKLGGDIIVQNVDTLKKMLAARPKNYSGKLPYLPVGNGGQVIQAKMKYINFQNGAGFRYLTQLASDVSPVTNDRLVYIYQGISTDGGYYVSAIFPVTSTVLPANYDEAMKGQDDQKFSQNFTQYLSDVQGKLDGQGDDTFHPKLTLLDEMMGSIEIKK